jgi:hypothetical protein
MPSARGEAMQASGITQLGEMSIVEEMDSGRH